MTGTCAHCHEETLVARYRLQYVGLRWMCPGCAERLRAMGMGIEFELDAEPRKQRRPVVVERRRLLGALFRAARLAA